MRKLTQALALAATIVSTPLFTQNIDTCRLKIGTNLSAPSDLGGEFPFTNLMKNARTWFAHNNVLVSGGLNLWDTGYQKYMSFDNDGYPLELPVAGIPGSEAPQILRTTWGNTAALPAGTYTVEWDGTGDLDIWGDVAKKQVSTGKISFNLTPGVQNLLVLEINKSLAADHVRNIRVMLPGTAGPVMAQQVFNQSWLDKLEPFSTIRFADWGLTNNSGARKWADRTRLNDYTYTAKTGVPYEWMIYLCNQKKADAWVCIPHLASDDYIQSMATLFKSQLSSSQKIYVEYSNELWNMDLAQGHYGYDSLGQGLPWPNRLAPRIEHVMEIWTNVFGSQSGRLVRVLGMENENFNYGFQLYAQILNDGKKDLVDALAPAAYLRLQHVLLNQFSTAHDVINNARHTSFDQGFPTINGWRSHANFATSVQKKLLFYAGGQAFVPNPVGTSQPYCQALLDAQTSPEIYVLYRDLFDTLRSVAPLQKMVFMNYSLIAPKNCANGSWGALENQFAQQPPYLAVAPKYQALLDDMQDCSNSSPCPFAGTTAAISGATQVCVGYSGVYKAVQTANSYFWSVTGGTIQSGQGTNNIQVLWNSNQQPINGGVGLTITTGNCTATGSLPITQATLPAPWTSADIGSPTKKGDVCFDQPSGTMTVRGGGADIYGTTDRFQFVSQSFSGDFTLVARVTAVQNTSLYAKAGIMAREGSGASAKNVFVGLMANNQLFVQRRLASGGSTVRKVINYMSAPKWLKLTREGNTFKGWRSENGVDWTLVQANTVSMSSDLLLGLAVTSKNNTATCTGIFDKISITPGVTLNGSADDRADFPSDEISEKESGLTVFPNPAGREFTVLFSSNGETTGRLTFSDMTGRAVLSEELDVADGDNELPVSLPELPRGIYLLTLQTGDGVRVKKVAVE